MKTSATLPSAQRNLRDLPKGKSAIIQAIVPNFEEFGDLDDAVTQRLKDLGFLAGQSITVIGYGFLGKDPIAVRVGGGQFALRQAEALKVQLTAESKVAVA